MRTIQVGAWSVGLRAKYGEYNCGNKTTGRLELVVTDGTSNTNKGAQQVIKELESVDLRDKIIKNFLLDVASATTYGKLKDGCSFFPSDGGVYPPGVLIYADRIEMDIAYTWYNNWKALIELFEHEPKFDVKIVKSPIIANRYYGTSAPSRVWTILLPSISKHTCYNKKTVSPEMRNSLSELLLYGVSDSLKQEIEELGVAA